MRHPSQKSSVRKGRSLASQFLILQIAIVLAVLMGVLAISLAQSAQTLQRVEGRRSLVAAETLAALPAVRSLMPTAQPRMGAALPSAAESVRSVSASEYAVLAKADGTVMSSQDPAQLGTIMEFGDSDVRLGKSWTGLITTNGRTALAAHVPVIGDDGTMVGIAVVGREYPSLWERLLQAVPNLITYLGISSVVGVAGSFLLARRVKRQTMGLEPDEILGLVEHREAILYGVKEGVVALDPHGRITLANDSAQELLHLPGDCIGKNVEDLAIHADVRGILTQEHATPDQLVLVEGRMVACNRLPISSNGRIIGSVTTLRDRTELSQLESELGATRMTTDTLRAQTHEFANQLHTISGLIQLEEYDEVTRFVDGVSHHRTRLYDDVTTAIKDPALAALFIAKASLASERGVRLELVKESFLPRMEESLSLDVNTVVGNLIDNAMDASQGTPNPVVEVFLAEDDDHILIIVQDSGVGIPAELADSVFRQGFSTKTSGSETERGFGLAICRLICRRRHGDITFTDDDGTVFTAVLETAGVRP